MGTVSGVTSQLNAIGGCTPARDCCSDVDALKGELARLNQRIAAIEGDSKNALQQASSALSNALDAKADALVITGEINGINNHIGEIAVGAAAASTLAARAWGAVVALGSALAPLLAAAPAILVAIAGIAAIGLSIAAAQTLAQSAYDLAWTALKIGSSAGDQAATAILQIREAEAKASNALGAASSASSEANQALSASTNAAATASQASSAASSASSIADRALVTALGAAATADRAISISEPLPGQLSETRSIASTAKATADRAISISEPLPGQLSETRSIASTAKATADRAIQIAETATSRQGIAGRDGINGKDGKDGKNATDTDVKDLTRRFGILENRELNKPVNPGKEDEIIRLIQGTRFDVLSLPAALVASQPLKEAMTSAAAVGSCRSSRPGGCPGGTPDRFNSLDGKLNGISSAFGALNNAVLGTITSTLNVINTKLGSQITGGLSAWSASIAEVVNRSQILNILTYISVLHNAYFLSNSLAQTLFSAVSNSLAALGIKDTSKDPAGTPFNIGKIVGDWTEGFFKATFGVATVEGIKADWKKYSRIYQAAAQVMYSFQSIGHSILGALEVVGSHVSKIGNALQKFRAVGEKAYGWMNPQPFFQNRFFTGLQATQEVVSQVDQVASEVLSVQETITQLGKNKDDLTKSVGEDPNGKKADVTPEAAQIKVTEAAAKAASKSPEIPESSQVKP